MTWIKWGPIRRPARPAPGQRELDAMLKLYLERPFRLPLVPVVAASKTLEQLREFFQ